MIFFAAVFGLTLASLASAVVSKYLNFVMNCFREVTRWDTVGNVHYHFSVIWY